MSSRGEGSPGHQVISQGEDGFPRKPEVEFVVNVQAELGRDFHDCHAGYQKHRFKSRDPRLKRIFEAMIFTALTVHFEKETRCRWLRERSRTCRSPSSPRANLGVSDGSQGQRLSDRGLANSRNNSTPSTSSESLNNSMPTFERSSPPLASVHKKE